MFFLLFPVLFVWVNLEFSKFKTPGKLNENEITVSPLERFWAHEKCCREANPPRLHSNMEFVAAFRQGKHVCYSHDRTNITS